MPKTAVKRAADCTLQNSMTMFQGVSGPVSFRPVLCGEVGAHWASSLGMANSPAQGLVSLAARVGERGGGRQGGKGRDSC